MKKITFFSKEHVFNFAIVLLFLAFFQIISVKVNAQGDEPTTAIGVDPATGCIDATIDPALYTLSAGIPAPTCYTNPMTPDVWFVVNVPASGELLLAPTGTGDPVMAVYTYDPATITYTEVGCSDDEGVGAMPLLSINTLTPGTTVYIRLWAYFAGSSINFQFCSFDCVSTTDYYTDADGDGVGAGAATASCSPIPGLVTLNGDCNDADQNIYPGSTEFCGDGIDNNCDTQVDEGCTTDADGDGEVDAVDCAPFNAEINSLASEICNTLDDNCDGQVDNGLPFTTYYPDLDGDGFGSLTGEAFCYDPSSPPLCQITFNLSDTWGDGWNNGYMELTSGGGTVLEATIGQLFTAGSTFQEVVALPNGVAYDLTWTVPGGYPNEVVMDVLDQSASVLYNLPASSGALAGTLLTTFTTSCAPTVSYLVVSGDCDDSDASINPGANNCVFLDTDADGFTSDLDCDDNNAAVNPAAVEVCDGLDNDCDIEIDEFVSTEYYADLDGDGFGDVNNTIFDCTQPAGYVTNFDDCDDTNITFQDSDGDGDGSAIIDACGVASSSDCDDNNSTVSSLAIEICENGVDDDCSGGDAFCAGVDLDADGFNAPADCNDNDASINPAATEVCGDGIDQNCSGIADEGCSAADNDGDGFDALTDCNDNCATIYPGAPCNDGDAATIDETLQGDCTCGGGTTIVSCLGPQSISFEPAPTAGTWPVGTNVTICYTLDYGQNSGDWLDGMAITLGTGWSLATPLTAPLECNGGPGDWIWQESIAPTGGSAYPAGQGYYYDYTVDGNGGNDWGDAGSCVFSMCFTATTVAAVDLAVTVASGGDSQFGSYTSTAGCPIEPFTTDPVSLPACSIEFPFCATPSSCDPITNQYTLVQAQNNYINTALSPATGTLDLYLDGNIIQTWNAPFNSSLPINTSALDSDGATHTLMAMFSANPGCMGTTTFVAPAFCAGQDDDADGYVAADDCNDLDATVNPGAPEICDLQDNNCDGVIDENQDADGDGFNSCSGDCNDNDNTIWIGATCNDNDPNTTNDLIQADCSCAGVLGDEPTNAIVADPASGCIDVTIDPNAYTPSQGIPAPTCYFGTITSDVWFMVNVPASGTLFLGPVGLGDAVMSIYTFDPLSGVYTEVGCDDDTGPGFMPQITNTTLAPGTPVYVRLWAYTGTNTINFSFCSSDCANALAYYPDADGDTFGDGSVTPVLTCTPDPGFVANNTDCNDASAVAFPGGTEVCGDNIDNNCDGVVDEGCTTDIDGDGFVTADDCDDNNLAIYPGATEICDLVDNNCDALIDEGFDLDGDGFTSCNGDCNDNDNTVWVGAVCNDNDPATGGDQIQADCSCLGYISLAGDEPWTAFTADPNSGCIDVTIDPNIYSASQGIAAPSCYFGTVAGDVWFSVNVPSSGTLFLAPTGAGDAVMSVYTFDSATGVYTEVGCDDDNFPSLMPQITITTIPAGTQVFIRLWAYSGTNTINFNFCASDCTTALNYYPDADGDTFGDALAIPVLTCNPDPTWVDNNNDCNDASAAEFPGGVEVCGDNIDNNCDGQADEGCTTDADADGDVDAVDCAPFNPNINSLAAEVCNTIDDNCNGLVDDGLSTTTYYLDADNDTFGGATSIQSCFNPNSPPVCTYTFSLIDAYGDGWNGNQMQLTSNGGATIDATIGALFTTGSALQETVLLTSGVSYDLTWNTVGSFTTEVGIDVLSPIGDIIYSLPTGSAGSAGTLLTTISVTCPALGVYVTTSTDCDDANATANPNGVEVCGNGIDEDCSGADLTCTGTDADGDGFDVTADCNDNDATINPSATEICGNTIDEDCSGADLACTGTDADGDGFDASVDCNDNNAAINPSATEICGNTIDEDCSGADLACTGTDADADGFDA
ncbi:MAG: hypothetical protein RLY35_1419, partial [Bacteroidota bacterium]